MSEVRHQVFISSTFRDLVEPRRKIAEALLDMDCIPAGMELFPAADQEQLEYIKRVIDDCDYYVVVVGARYGSVTAEGLSFTEQEYRYAREKGVPVLAFIHGAPEKLSFENSEADPELRAKLAAFRAELQKGRLTAQWNTTEELVNQVWKAVTKAKKTHPRPGWVRGGLAATNEVLDELVKSQRRVLELEGQLQLHAKVEAELSFPRMNIAYETSDSFGHGLIRLDDIYLALSGVIATPTTWASISNAVTDIVAKKMEVSQRMSLVSGEVNRVISYLYAKGLLLVEGENSDRKYQISDRGREVVAGLIDRMDDEPDTLPF